MMPTLFKSKHHLLCKANEVIMVCNDVGQLNINYQHYLNRETGISICIANKLQKLGLGLGLAANPNPNPNCRS